MTESKITLKPASEMKNMVDSQDTETNIRVSELFEMVEAAVKYGDYSFSIINPEAETKRVLRRFYNAGYSIKIRILYGGVETTISWGKNNPSLFISHTDKYYKEFDEFYDSLQYVINH